MDHLRWHPTAIVGLLLILLALILLAAGPHRPVVDGRHIILLAGAALWLPALLDRLTGGDER